MTYRWIQPDLKAPSHVLQDDGGAVVAELRFTPPAGAVWNARNRQTAEARVAGSRWTFSIERSGLSGFLGFSSTVRVAGPQGGEISTGANFVNGKAALGGREIEWHSSATRPGGSRFTATDGTVLVHFAPGAIQNHVNTTVEIENHPTERQNDLLLAALGLYLRIAGRRFFR